VVDKLDSLDKIELGNALEKWSMERAALGSVEWVLSELALVELARVELVLVELERVELERVELARVELGFVVRLVRVEGGERPGVQLGCTQRALQLFLEGCIRHSDRGRLEEHIRFGAQQHSAQRPFSREGRIRLCERLHAQ
jgi:hypothetical protein